MTPTPDLFSSTSRPFERHAAQRRLARDLADESEPLRSGSDAVKGKAEERDKQAREREEQLQEKLESQQKKFQICWEELLKRTDNVNSLNKEVVGLEKKLQDQELKIMDGKTAEEWRERCQHLLELKTVDGKDS